MKTTGRNIFAWDVEYISESVSGITDIENKYLSGHLLHNKWNELLKHYNSCIKVRTVKTEEEFIHIFEHKGYAYSRGNEPRQLAVKVGGTSYTINFMFGSDSYFIKIKPECTGHNASKLSAPPQVAVCFMESYARLAAELPGAMEESVLLAQKKQTINSIEYPYLTSRIEESGVLEGTEYSLWNNGRNTMLYIRMPGELQHICHEGIITIDNIDMVLEALPSALDDPENFSFYIPSFWQTSENI